MLAKTIDDIHHPDIQRFFAECQTLGFSNNVSSESIKYHWTRNERKGCFWALYIQERIVGMAGCHWMPEIHEKAFRIQFRGCEIPGTDPKKTLSRSHFNSMTFRELIPLQLNWIEQFGEYEVFLSTNHDNKNHRAMQLIAQQGFLTEFDVGEYFSVQQTIWKFNSQHYKSVRSKIKSYLYE